MKKPFLTILLILSIIYSYAQDSWQKIKSNGKGSIEVKFINYKPFFYEENGEYKGIEYEIFKEYINNIESKNNVKINVKYTSYDKWNYFYNSVKSSKKGVFGFGTISIIPQREKEVQFSKPYMPDVSVLISSSNLPVITNTKDVYKDFKGATGLTTKGSVFQGDMKDLIKKYKRLSIKIFDDYGDVLKKVTKEDNYYAFVSLSDYFKFRQEGVHVKRQYLFTKKRKGLAIAMPLDSDWKESLNNYLSSSAAKELLEITLKEQLGQELYEVTIKEAGNERFLRTKENELREKELRDRITEVTTAQKDIESKNKLIYIAIGLLGLVAILLILFLFRLRKQKKSNQVLGQLNKQVESQKVELQNSNAVMDQKNIELKEQKDQVELAKNELQAQNQKVYDSMRAGKSIQTALLPYEKDFKEVFSDYFVIWIPKDVVSGDFYWLSTSGNSSFVAAIDCTGHGVPGAFVSMLGFALLNDIINVQGCKEPNTILEKLHFGIKSSLMKGGSDEKHGMDVSFCRVDKITEEDFQVTFAGAKRPLYYIQEGKLRRINGDRQGIGGGLMTLTNKKLSFSNFGISLTKGDVIYLTSDGYADTPNSKRKKLGINRMEEYFEEYSSFPMKWQYNKFLENMNEFQGAVSPRDDVTIVGVKL